MDVEERIFMKLDKMESRLVDICIRLTTVENNHQDHLDSIQKKHAQKLHRRDFLIVLFTTIVGTAEVLRTLGVI